MGESVVRALDGVDVHIEAGDFVSITGASGSGKSTLMHILGCLDRPTSGTLEFRSQTISRMNERKLARLRNLHVGFVFQTFNLINRTTALENVCVPLMYTRRAYSRKTAMAALERVGLRERAKHRPGEMSGGECQRVAIARAIVNSPELILADEPTGNLDSRTGEQIMQFFQELNAGGITIVLVTHESEVAVKASRMIQMKDGRVVADTVVDEKRRRETLSLTRDARTRMYQHETAAQGGPSSPARIPGPESVREGR